MKELLIVSGKGGTGKTTLASAFIKLAEARAYADCDVDAPNLHLIAQDLPKPKVTDYFGLDKAIIDKDICTSCGICRDLCRFGAIIKGPVYSVNPISCEGCGVCELVCPVKAISLVPAVAGELRLHKSTAIFSTAQLKIGSGNSGLLVTDVKKSLRQGAENVDFAIIDGSPGIGCPVHASLSGVDLVLLVAEPSLSGLSDLERIMDTADRFEINQVACINKYDTNLKISSKIDQLCSDRGIPLLGKMPFDPLAASLVNKGLSIVEASCPAGQSVKDIFNKTMNYLLNNNGGMKMKIAVAADDGKIAGHFGHCATYELFSVENGEIVRKESLSNPGHKPGFLPNFLHDQGVTVMIAGGIGSAAVNIFSEKGITVVAGASGPIQNVVEEYLRGSLEHSGEVCQH